MKRPSSGAKRSFSHQEKRSEGPEAPGHAPGRLTLSLTMTDWDQLGEAVSSVDIIARGRCRNIAELEDLNHSTGQLGRF